MKMNPNALAALCLLAASLTSPLTLAVETTPAMNDLGWTFAYDDGDRVVKVTDPAGRDTRFEYAFDAKTKGMVRQVRTAADGIRVSHEFDGAGRVTRMTDAAGAVAYDYNDRGLLTKVQREGGPAISYSYDAQGRVTRRQVGDFFTLDYGYDFLGRLAFMDTPAGRVEYAYETGQGTLVRTLPNGVKTFETFAPNGSLSEITHGFFPDPKGTRYQLLARFQYSYRPDGLIAGIAEVSPGGERTTTYDYDTSGRLVRAGESGGRAYAYIYDPVSNRLKAEATGAPPQTATFDWAGRLTSLNGIPTAHDAAGNLTAVTLGGEAMSYRYNADNQLAGSGDGRVSYRYDGEGRLIARTVGGAETGFIPDPLSSYWQPLVMQGQDGRRTLVVWEGDKPLMLIEDGRAQYLLHDHLGSVRLVTDIKGEVTQRTDYEPFGTPVDSAAAAEFAPRFAGLFWDGEAKSYVTLARAYRADLGRFLGVEPKRRPPSIAQKGLALYEYCNADPVNFSDRNGAAPAPASDSYFPDMKALLFMQREAAISRASHTMSQDWWVFKGLEATAYDWLSMYDPHKPVDSRQLAAEIIGGLIPYHNIALGIERATWSGVSGRYGDSVKDLAYAAAATAGLSASGLTKVGEAVGRPVAGNLMPIVKWLEGIDNAGTAAGLVENAKTLTELNFHRHLTPSGPTFQGLSIDRAGFGAPFQSPPLPASTTWHGAVVRTSSQRATPEEIAAYKAAGKYVSRESGVGDRALSPSPVGGVYLGGSGQSLEGIGLLDGIAQDANGNLVLVGQTGGEIKLPPLRLDDVVTVFRSVYLDGEGPTVTIDPDRKDPHGPNMNVINNQATERTYVGWVLFQADRLMKGYNLGEDNETRREVTSAVPGYADVLDTTYFGGGHAGAAADGGSWERFWIVPAGARRFAAAPQALTVLDVPLKVRTQPMKWDKGELVDDPKRAPSKGAAAFTQWFTANYDGIAAEQWLTPPEESGIDTPVPIFTELRRIALLTAIAETLRDQDVPLPFWMRDYSVKPVPYKGTTPSLTTTRSQGDRRVQIFGGVSLSPPTADVQAVTKASDVGKLPKAERVAAQTTLDRSASLSEAVRAQMPVPEPLRVQSLTGQGAGYQAVAIPGGETRALSPVTLDETDLSIPIGGGQDIRLTRRFNSFFDPSGPWGLGWTLDLPRLVEVKIPETRGAQGDIRYRLAHELVTPLNSAYTRFARVAAVPELNGSRLMVPDKPGDFLALADGHPDFLTVPTQKVIRKDGEVWHFHQGGDLVATERNGYRRVYERDSGGLITRIVGIQGKVLAGTIDLAYDPASGRLQSATGQRQTGQAPRAGDVVTISYTYDTEGRLVGVQGEEGRTGYRYTGPRVAALTYQAPSTPPEQAPPEIRLRAFEYDQRGQLLAETDAAGRRTEYRVAADASGHSLAVAPSGADGAGESVRYDPAFRPIEAQFADGTRATWSYPPGGGMSMVLAQPDGETARLTESADLSQQTLELGKDRKLVGAYDTAGRLTSLTDNGSLVLRQAWSPNGRLTLAANETTAAHQDYDADGLVARVLLTPPNDKGQFKHWQETKLDPAGRPREITDYRGLKVAMDYDGSGDLVAIATERDGKNYGYQLTRDTSGRIQEVTSSWGQQHYRYDDVGEIQRVDMKDGDAHAQIEWNAGQLARVRQFDGGTLAIDYYQKGPQAGLPEKITAPNALELKYQYDASQRLASVDVGGQSRLALGYDAKGRVAAWTYSPPNP